MKAAFIVTLEVDTLDPTNLNIIAEDIGDELEAAGFVVEEVKPWSRHKHGPHSSGLMTFFE